MNTICRTRTRRNANHGASRRKEWEKMDIEKEVQGKRLLNVAEMLKYTGLGRTSGLAWCKKIGALKHIGSRALYDKAIIDKAIDELTE